MVIKKVIKQTPPKAPETRKPEPTPVENHPKKFGEGHCVECGKPVAPGQTYVCKDHQRTN